MSPLVFGIYRCGGEGVGGHIDVEETALSSEVEGAVAALHSSVTRHAPAFRPSPATTQPAGAWRFAFPRLLLQIAAVAHAALAVGVSSYHL